MSVGAAVTAVALAALVVAPHVQAAEEIHTIPTRDGVTTTYLLVMQPDSQPRWIVLTLIGGRGAIGLQERAAKGPIRFGPGANFLIRVREGFATPEIADAIIDAPSDHASGIDDAFRMSAEHARDVAGVAHDLAQRFPGARFVLVGTSRGSTSAASIAARNPELYGKAVLSSTVTVADRMGPNLSRFDFDSIRIPFLLVHHRDDACRSSPYAGVQQLAKRFPLTTVEGGDPPKSESCEPQAPHGYLGRETGTVEAIRQWLLTNTVTTTVH